MKTLNKLIKFLLKWNELWTLPLAVLLFWISPIFLRKIDPTSATYDAGIFQIIIFAIVQFLSFTFIAWIYMKMVFPNAYKMLDDLFITSKSNKLTQWQKSRLVLVLFLSLLFALVLLARVI